MAKYRVMVELCSGELEDCWHEDEGLMRFDSIAEAQEEIEEHIHTCHEAFLRGDMSGVPSPDDFHIEEVDENDEPVSQTISMVDAIEAVNEAVNGFDEDCIGEDTPENEVARERLWAAWARVKKATGVEV